MKTVSLILKDKSISLREMPVARSVVGRHWQPKIRMLPSMPQLGQNIQTNGSQIKAHEPPNLFERGEKEQKKKRSEVGRHPHLS